MHFVGSVIEATGVIEQMFGSNSKEMRDFQKVLKGYVIKRAKTREDIKTKFEQITKGQTTDKTTTEKIKEVLYWMLMYI